MRRYIAYNDYTLVVYSVFSSDLQNRQFMILPLFLLCPNQILYPIRNILNTAIFHNFSINAWQYMKKYDNI